MAVCGGEGEVVLEDVHRVDAGVEMAGGRARSAEALRGKKLAGGSGAEGGKPVLLRVDCADRR